MLWLVLMRWVNVRVSLRVLSWHVVRVASPSLLVVGGVMSRIVEGVDGLVLISLKSRRRHGPGYVCLAEVGM